MRCRVFLGVVAVAYVIAMLVATGRAVADGPNRAGVVVSFGDGRSESVCVEFSEAEISGAELLRRSGLTTVTMSGGAGSAVCMIDGVGCGNPGDCFCQCHGDGCRYWAYYTLADGAWRYSATGSSLRKVHDGDVDGWAWGAGSIGNGAKPELRTFEEICLPAGRHGPPPVAPAPPSSTPTAAPVAQAVVTPEDTAATPSPAGTRSVDSASVAASTMAPTARPSPAPSPTVAAASGTGQGSRPGWQIALFTAVVTALALTALVLLRRRTSG